jgi:hypothetical protein
MILMQDYKYSTEIAENAIFNQAFETVSTLITSITCHQSCTIKVKHKFLLNRQSIQA